MASLSDHSVDERSDRPDIVGREREQALLRRALDAMLGGHGSLLLVGGEAGIGKTTLVEWLAEAAERTGALVLWGHAYDFSTTPPYGPWLEIWSRYRRLGEGLPPAPSFIRDAEELAKVGSQATLFAASAEFLAAIAAQVPLVMILDDLHWADQASLDFLRFLARQLEPQRMLVIGTYRTDELHRRHPLFALLPVLVREANAERLDVRSLNASGQRALIRRRYPLPHEDQQRLERYLVDHAEGNPLYAGELLRMLAEEGILAQREDGWVLGELPSARIPVLLLQVIERRLTRLEDEARSLLQVAAIIGQEVPLGLWQRVSGVSDDALLVAIEQGQAATLIEEVRDSAACRFRHALLREALYDELFVLRRRAWHRRVAEELEATPHPDPDAVAYHFEHAGDERATAWLIRAGERAQRSYVWSTAVERFDAALAKLTEQGAPEAERAALLMRIAFVLRYSDAHRALELLDEARLLATQAGEPALASYCRFFAGLLQCFAGDVRSGLVAMEQGVGALASLSGADQARLEALVGGSNTPVGTLVLWLALAGRLEEARARGLAMQVEGDAPDAAPRQDRSASRSVPSGRSSRPRPSTTPWRTRR